MQVHISQGITPPLMIVDPPCHLPSCLETNIITPLTQNQHLLVLLAPNMNATPPPPNLDGQHDTPFVISLLQLEHTIMPRQKA